MKLKIYILVSSILFSCNQVNEKVISNPATIDSIRQVKQSNSSLIKEGSMNRDSLSISFDNYLMSLDQIQLPLKHNVLGDFPEISNDYDKQGFEKFKHAWASKPLGILFRDDSVITLVDCSIGDAGLVPLFMTYDKLGNKIDSLAPYKKSGEDDGYFAIEYLKILPNKTLIVEDSVTTWPAHQDRSKQNEKVVTGIAKYSFGKDGRIILE